MLCSLIRPPRLLKSYWAGSKVTRKRNGLAKVGHSVILEATFGITFISILWSDFVYIACAEKQ